MPAKKAVATKKPASARKSVAAKPKPAAAKAPKVSSKAVAKDLATMLEQVQRTPLSRVNELLLLLGTVLDREAAEPFLRKIPARVFNVVTPSLEATRHTLEFYAEAGDFPSPILAVLVRLDAKGALEMLQGLVGQDAKRKERLVEALTQAIVTTGASAAGPLRTLLASFAGPDPAAEEKENGRRARRILTERPPSEFVEFLAAVGKVRIEADFDLWLFRCLQDSPGNAVQAFARIDQLIPCSREMPLPEHRKSTLTLFLVAALMVGDKAAQAGCLARLQKESDADLATALARTLPCSVYGNDRDWKPVVPATLAQDFAGWRRNPTKVSAPSALKDFLASF